MSYYPIVLAAGFTIVGAGLMTIVPVIVIGAIVLFWGLLGWAFEPVNDPEPNAHGH